MTVTFQGRPPQEAIDYLERKVVGGRFSFDWRDVWQEEHLNSFVVAKMGSQDLLADVHASLIAAAKAGTTPAQWAKDITPMLQSQGWWGKQKAIDPTTGEEKLVQLGSPERLNTIFDTNMRMAHSAGRWERVQRSKADRPFLQYKHTPQARPRPQHLAWDGITLPVDHPFWLTHWCPNGWKCKCWTLSLRRAEEITSEDELKRRGAYRTMTYRNKRTGQVSKVPFGIDPGFGYNVGRARLAGLEPPVLDQLPGRPTVLTPRQPATLPPPPTPRPPPYSAKLRGDLGDDGQAIFDAFSAVMGKGEGEVFIDRAQAPVIVSRSLFQRKDALGEWVGDKTNLASRGKYAEILAATLRDPDEIWFSLQERGDGSSAFVRTYVAALDLGAGERQWFMVSFSQRDGVWYGATAFAPAERHRPDKALNYLNQFGRVGALVYQRK